MQQMQERFVVPAQASGKNLTRPPMPAAAPAVLLPSFLLNKGYKTLVTQ